MLGLIDAAEGEEDDVEEDAEEDEHQTVRVRGGAQRRQTAPRRATAAPVLEDEKEMSWMAFPRYFRSVCVLDGVPLVL